MDKLYMMAPVLVALLAGLCLGVKLEDSAWRKATRRPQRAEKRKESVVDIPTVPFPTSEANTMQYIFDDTNTGKKNRRKRLSASKLIAMGVLLMDAASTFAVLYLCYLAIKERFDGALPYLTTLIGALQAATAIVLSGYFYKSKAENTAGGITYDAALGTGSNTTTEEEAQG